MLTQSKKPIRRFFHAFVDGQYDLLFSCYRSEERIENLVERLCRKEGLKKEITLVGGSRGRKLWATIRPDSTRQGVVMASNFIAQGTVVRSRIPWSHGTRPRAAGSAQTVLDPQWLRIESLPVAEVQAQRRRAA